MGKIIQKGTHVDNFTPNMAKEILFYTPIYSSSVADFIRSMEAAKDEDVRIRMNCPGGDVLAGYGAMAKFNEHPKGKSIHVDGAAESGGAFMCAAARAAGNEVTCLDASEFLLHRAAYPEYIESNKNYFTEDMRKGLDGMNATLRNILEKFCTPMTFEAVTGCTYDEMFSMDDRKDVCLNADQAYRMGLVSKPPIPLTSNMMAEITALSSKTGIAAFKNREVKPQIAAQPQNNKNKTMNTIEDLKSQYPAIYDQAVKAGVEAERERVAAWEAWRDVSAEKAAAGIASGKHPNSKDFSEFTRIALGKELVSEAAKAGVPAVATAANTTVDPTGAPTVDPEVEAFRKEFATAIGREAK
jgi:ATP-dependent protease ClpP protease subunit